MAYEEYLVKASQVHGPLQHAHILLGVGDVQGAHHFVSEQSFIANTFALPHILDGDAQIDGFGDPPLVCTRFPGVSAVCVRRAQ